MSAYVRHGTEDDSITRLRSVSAVETAMLQVMQEPDAEQHDWLHVSLRSLNQALQDRGVDSSPELRRKLLDSLSRDGRGFAASRGSLEFRAAGREAYRLKLHRGGALVTEISQRRREVARVVLDAILAHIPADSPASDGLLVEFSSEDLTRALQADPELQRQIKDPLGAIDRGLMYLHEQDCLILEHGLSIFRQAMTIRLMPESKGRRYTQGDFDPLQRAIAHPSHQQIVDDLRDPTQQAVVAALPKDNLLILAGPGSGKTRVVVHRVAFLVRVQRIPAQQILVLCFNRLAAVQLKRRLHQLMGPAAAHVTVLTYHALAARLTGTSFAQRLMHDADQPLDLADLIPAAVRVLRGQQPVPGVESDQVRDRLLAGTQYVLVDEYQDIDQQQYELISALTDRTGQDEDTRLSILWPSATTIRTSTRSAAPTSNSSGVFRPTTRPTSTACWKTTARQPISSTPLGNPIRPAAPGSGPFR